MDTVKLAKSLGWASMAIAAVESLGQGWVEEYLLGIDEKPRLMRGLAVREGVSGATILSQTHVTPMLAAGLWSRVAGDAMDIALLTTAAPKTRRPVSFVVSSMMVLGITALDVYCATRVQKRLAWVKYDEAHRGLRESPPPAALRSGPAAPVSETPVPAADVPSPA